MRVFGQRASDLVYLLLGSNLTYEKSDIEQYVAADVDDFHPNFRS